jgi:two-component system sensor histidine kinase/response regulator
MSQAPEPAAIVVIDDDSAMRLACRKILTHTGFRVETCESGTQGLEAVVTLKPALILLDLKMPGLSGMEVIPRVQELDPQIVIIVITGFATIDTAVEAMKLGAYDFLPKPFSPDELRLIVNRGLERRRLAMETHRGEVERALLKRSFVTFVSHQLQTPLVAVHQYLDVLRQLGEGPEMDARRKEWLERCLKRTEEMQAMIRDWLLLARLEGDTLARRGMRVDLKALIGEILAAYSLLAGESEVTLEALLPDDDCLVKGDPLCVRVLFDNLITNAIKYNKPGGSVTVTAAPAGDEILASVRDTGVGIPEKYRQLLFSEFFRIEGAKKTTGTGLGLAICRKVVAEMGGSITVESREAEGSTFFVRLLRWKEPAGGQEAQ